MNFDWFEFYRLADELVDRIDDLNHKSAVLRSAISRYYYAVYWPARTRLERLQRFIPGQEDPHWSVIKSYRDSRDQREKKIGRDLERLRNKRTDAEYNSSIDIGLPEAETAKTWADSIIDRLDVIDTRF